MLRTAISGPVARNSHAHVVHGIGMAIVSGGRIADMFGRRRVFFIGSILFGGLGR